MKKVALLCHRGGNIGHEFMAVGIEEALRSAFGPNVQIDHFEQHNPFEVYPEDHLFRQMHNVPHGRFGWLRKFLNGPFVRQYSWRQTKPLNYDLAVACGGPNIIPGGYRAPELGLMLHHMNGAFKYRGVPLIDAGVGSCFPFEKTRDSLENPEDRKFYRLAFGYTARIAVRDTIAAKVARSLGFAADLIPCGAICSGRVLQQVQGTNSPVAKPVIINFQRLGANTDWGQGVDASEWMRTMQAVLRSLQERHSVVLLAHNLSEVNVAAELAPHLKCVLPSTITEYGQIIASAKAAIVSRIHAAIPLAGIGVPSVVVGTDTRISAIEQIGLPTCYVKHARADWLIDQLENLVANAADERKRLLELREETLLRYSDLFQTYARFP